MSLPPGHRHPYVGDGADGALRSAQIDREEVDGLDRDDPRVERLLSSAAAWEQQAAELQPALRHVIRLITDPADLDGGPLVATYDPNGNDGYGSLQVTDDPAAALHFPDMREAFECYRQVSTVRPVRPDGQPNRPLTAFTITVDTLDA